MRDKQRKNEELREMSMKAILFDLDGTLLPMDQDAFTAGYFKLLAKKLSPHGYEAQTLVRAIWDGTEKMVKNDGSRSNEEAFWECFEELLGEKVRIEKNLFEEFYEVDFRQAKDFCGFNPLAQKAVLRAKELGFRVALATNPIFPEIATRSRTNWAGLDVQDFELFTTYENTGLAKPNAKYFIDVANRMGLNPRECLMVGNDAREDVAAQQVGMQVFLVTDCLINKYEDDISGIPQGTFEDLIRFLEKLK